MNSVYQISWGNSGWDLLKSVVFTQKEKIIPEPVSDIDPVSVIEALRRGDHKAFQEIFFKYYGKVKQFIFLMIKSRDEAEELSQQVFVDLWQKREKINTEKNFRAFLYTLARNAVYDDYKKKIAQESRLGDYVFSDSVESSDESIIAQETQMLIDMAVCRMPKQRKRIFEMSRVEGLTNDEIAERLDITKKGVEKQLRLALNDIKEVLTLFFLLFAGH